MKFFITSTLIFLIATCVFGKSEKKKLDLTTISRPAPKTPEIEKSIDETEADGEVSPASKTTIKDGYSAIDLRLDEANKPIKTNSIATVKCRTASGIQYLPTDSGFESCLKQNEIEKSRAANREGEPTKNADQTAGQSVDFSFGEGH